MWAVKNNKYKISEILVKNNANVNHEDMKVPH